MYNYTSWTDQFIKNSKLHVYDSFRLIDLSKSLQYLKEIAYYEIRYDVKLFVNLPEEEIANYHFTDNIKYVGEDLLDRVHGHKESNDYIVYNTTIFAMRIIIKCAALNKAIKTFRYIRSSNNMGYCEQLNLKDKDVQCIKYASIAARDEIHAFSEKYTVKDFEKDFINDVKTQVYAINRHFLLDTRTSQEKLEDFGMDLLTKVIFALIIVFSFYLLATCVSKI